MASSFAFESGQSRTNAPRLCYCRERSPVKTSMTSGNMGRRFYGCARYGVYVTCGYFEWVDPPMCQRGREVLSRMVAKMNRLEKELARSRRREKMFCKALFETWVAFCTMEEPLLAVLFQPNHAGLEQGASLSCRLQDNVAYCNKGAHSPLASLFEQIWNLLHVYKN
ncbi:unnamed protein product [Camellia sinensis]